MTEQEPKLTILGFLCNSVFFFGVIFSAVVENIAIDAKYVFHYLVEDSHRLNLLSVHHDGFGSAKKKMGQKETSPSPARKSHPCSDRKKEVG